MYSTGLLFRIAKVLVTAATGFMSLLIVIGNTTDYYTNFHFVQHVMKMDTIFPGSKVYYRHIDSPALYHGGYILLILLETIMCFCCIRGTWSLINNLKNASIDFHHAKNWAVAGFLTGIIIWFLGFEVVGGEWFAMWQSQQWNGLVSAERISSFLLLSLLLVQTKDD